MLSPFTPHFGSESLNQPLKSFPSFGRMTEVRLPERGEAEACLSSIEGRMAILISLGSLDRWLRELSLMTLPSDLGEESESDA